MTVYSLIWLGGQSFFNGILALIAKLIELPASIAR